MSAAITAVGNPDGDLVYASFAAFHERFAGVFPRPEPRSHAGKYLRALMGPVERRNGWQIAEAVGDASPGAVQRLLHQAVWSADEAGDRLREIVRETFGDPEGIGVVDETGFLKKGTESVGVGRQYTGTAGKIENCQVGVFVSYVSPKGHVLLEREIYLPKAWAADAARREKAKVPREVRFQTKPALARRMLARTWAAGMPMRWVTGDEVYGNDPKFRDFVTAHGRRFVLAVGCKTRVWTTRPALEPVPRKRSRKSTSRRAMRVVQGAAPALPVDAVVASWRPQAWQRVVTQFGEKGPIEHDWAAVRVVECRSKRPGPDRWLLARRSVSNPSEIAYYLAEAPLDTPLQSLAMVASSRYTIEQCFEEAKDDVGMDHYEVRQWPSWYRHITLCMMALVWLTLARAGLDQAMLAAFRGVTVPNRDAAPPHLSVPLDTLLGPSSTAFTPPTTSALAAPTEVHPEATERIESAIVVDGPEAPTSQVDLVSVPSSDSGKKGGPTQTRHG